MYRQRMDRPLSETGHGARGTAAPLVTAVLLAGYAVLVLVVAVQSLTSGTSTSSVTGAGLIALAVVLLGTVAALGAAAPRARRGDLTADELGRVGSTALGFGAAVWAIAALSLFVRMMPGAPESTGQLLLVTMASLVPAGLLTAVGRGLRANTR